MSVSAGLWINPSCSSWSCSARVIPEYIVSQYRSQLNVSQRNGTAYALSNAYGYDVTGFASRGIDRRSGENLLLTWFREAGYPFEISGSSSKETGTGFTLSARLECKFAGCGASGPGVSGAVGGPIGGVVGAGSQSSVCTCACGVSGLV